MKKRTRLILPVLLLCSLLMQSVSIAYSATVQQVHSESELRNAFFDGGSYQLAGDIILEQTILLSDASPDGIFASGHVTLDLNGYTITSSASAIEIKGYGSRNGNGDITLYDTVGTGGILTTGTLSAPIRLPSDSQDTYTCVLSIEGGFYSGGVAGLQVGNNLVASQVLISKGVFACRSGSPISGPYQTNNTVHPSPDGKTWTITEENDGSSATDAVQESSTLAPPPDGGTLLTGDGETEQHPVPFTVSTALPRASYTIRIPAEVPVPLLERADASDETRFQETPFSVCLCATSNFFDEKAVQITIQSDCTLQKDANRENLLYYTMLQAEHIYTPGTLFAELSTEGQQATGAVVIDRSQIRTSGVYQGKLEFSITLIDKN